MLINKPLILSTGTGVAPAHTIDQSIRFNDDDSAYMSKTFASAGNRKTWSLSFWWKRGNLSSVANKRQILFRGGTFSFYSNHNSSTIDGINFSYTATANDLQTTQVFRDPSAWYHIVVNMDTSNPITPERVRLYVNGSRVTSFASSSYPSLNTEYQFNSNVEHNIGRRSAGEELDGYLAEIVFIDGQALDPSSFGLYNDSNIWIPKDVSGLTFGTNGFHIKGESASDLGNDSSGNNNDFTTSGLASHDQVFDTPTNNFCVANPLNKGAGVTISEGNLKSASSNADEFYVTSSMGVNTGKWYMEAYLISITGGQTLIGITSNSGEDRRNDQFPGQNTYSYGYANGASGFMTNLTAQAGTWATYTNGDIISVALDLDNNLIYVYKNGAIQNSGTGFSITDPASTTDGFYFFATGDGNASHNGQWVYNYGQDSTFSGLYTQSNSYVADSNNYVGASDGNGVGSFFYTPPTGYLALCTKNLGS